MADDSVSRRQLLLSVGFAGSLAGCSTVLDGDGTDTADRTETTTSAASVASSPAVTPAGTRTDTPTREPSDTTPQEPTDTTTREPQPDIDVTETTISENTLRTGGTLELVVAVTNAGDAEGTADLSIGLDGADGTEATVDVSPGETVQRTFTREMQEAGTFAVSLNGETIGEVTVEPPEVLHVRTDGDAGNPGTETAPLSSIDDAVDRAGPGQTVQVHSGEYVEYVEFTTAGDPDAPITLTGPPDAVLKPPETHESQVITVAASHVHLTGLTITGLHDPDGSGDPGLYPTDPGSYHSGKLIDLNTFPDGGDDYLEGLVVSPHRIGNAGTSFINSQMIRDSEIGGFEVIGPAGANWILDDTEDHKGEMVYLGTAADNRVDRGYEEYDRTRNVRVHHIDNSAGYPHSELVDCKGGVENITVEYCTDGGGAQTHQGPYSRAVSLDGHGCTIRWNDIRDVEGDGVRIGPQGFMGDTERLEDPETDVERRMGKDHDIYGNVFTGCIHEGINFLRESLEPGRDSNPLPEDQRALCDNLSDGYDDALDGICPSDLPPGEGVGHLGGDSPWDGDAPTKEDVLSGYGRARELDTSVTAADVPTNTEIVAEVTVTNDGTDTAEVELRLQVDVRFELDTETVTLSPGETRENIELRDSGLPDPVEVIVTRKIKREGTRSRRFQKIGGLQVTDGS
ncbi:MAG: hypothetical protein ABEH88_01745 [Halobacteriales archaeon]